MANEVEVARPVGGVGIRPDQATFDEYQLASLKQLGVKNATAGDLAVYMHYCQRTSMDPFARQIYMIERDGKQTIQMGIDGFRIIAQRSHQYRGQTPAEWCGPDGVWKDVWLKETPPMAARVGVKRQGFDEPLYAVALWSSYAQYKREGGLTAMWGKHGPGQLAKCAEALALRKAFPNDLSGIYTEDELGDEDTISEVEASKPKMIKSEPEETISYTEEDFKIALELFDWIETFDTSAEMKAWFNSEKVQPYIHVPLDPDGLTINQAAFEKNKILEAKKSTDG